MDKKQSNSQKTARTALLVGGIVYGVSLIVWLILGGLLLLSYTSADAPFVYTTLFLYPIVAIGNLVVSFFLYKRDKFGLSLIILLVPLLWGCMAFSSYMALWLS